MQHSKEEMSLCRLSDDQSTHNIMARLVQVSAAHGKATSTVSKLPCPESGSY